MFRAATGAGALRSIPVVWPAATTTGKSVGRTISVAHVVNAQGEGVSGATIRYNDNGGNTWFHARGGAGTDANGMLGFAIDGLKTTVHHRAQQARTVAIQSYDVAAQPLNVFRTTRVQMNYNHLVQYTQAESKDGAKYWFTRSGMELFPGTYTFRYQVPDQKLGNAKSVYAPLELTVGSDAINKTVAAVRLTDSKGDALAGGQVAVSKYGSGWQSDKPVTDETGVALWSYDGNPTRATFALTYEGTRIQNAQQDLASKSVAFFRTVPVTVNLLDYEGNAFTSGKDATVSYYPSAVAGWTDFGTTDGATVTKELLPAKGVSFAMKYEGSREQRKIDLNQQTTIDFQTGLIQPCGIVEISSFYTDATKWRPFYEGLQLLPGKASFRVDGSQETWNVAAGEVNQTQLCAAAI